MSHPDAQTLAPQRIDLIRQRLLAAITDADITIDDESDKHAGHAGAATGLGHFALHIRSAQFDGLSTLQRHRLIYSALGDLMTTDIHALHITALGLN